MWSFIYALQLKKNIFLIYIFATNFGSVFSRMRPTCHVIESLFLKDTCRIVHVRLWSVKVRVCVEQLRDQRQHQGWMTRTQEL